MKKTILFVVPFFIVYSAFAQRNNKLSIELMKIEKTNYTVCNSKQPYTSNQILGNFLFPTQDYSIILAKNINEFKIKFGASYWSNNWKDYRRDTIEFDIIYYQNGYSAKIAIYEGTRILNEKSIIFPISIEKKIKLFGKKRYLFYTAEAGIAYQYKFSITNDFENLYNSYPSEITDLELKNEVYKNCFYSDKSILTRKDFKYYDKANKDMFHLFFINGVGYQFAQNLNISLNLINRMNVKRTKSFDDPQIKRWDGSVGLGLRVGIDL